MTIRPAGLLLIPFAAVCVIAAACSSDLAGPDGDTRGVRPRRTAIEPTTTTCSDSVVAGYGTCCTGGIEYTEFEYDPDTGTETVCREDPEAACKGLTYTTTCDSTYTPPPPPPPPAPSPTPTPAPTSPTPAR